MSCILLILVASVMNTQRLLDDEDAVGVNIGEPYDSRLMKRRTAKQQEAEKKKTT